MSTLASSIPAARGNAREGCDPLGIEATLSALGGVALNTAGRRWLIESGQRRRLWFSWERCATETASTCSNVLAA